jgi:hypothetical protein
LKNHLVSLTQRHQYVRKNGTIDDVIYNINITLKKRILLWFKYYCPCTIHLTPTYKLMGTFFERVLSNCREAVWQRVLSEPEPLNYLLWVYKALTFFIIFKRAETIYQWYLIYHKTTSIVPKLKMKFLFP